jgi:hypothetical protein
MRLSATSHAILFLAWLWSASGGWAQVQPTEYQVKAAFLFNFAKFVEWPSAAFDDPTSPIVIGILGDNPFHDDLANTIRGKKIDEHPLVVKEVHSATETTNCHILFISTSEKKRLPEILTGLKGASVLTVGEMDHFTEAGGMINFVLEKTKIRFQINSDAASTVRLKISSKLLNLAQPPGKVAARPTMTALILFG